jgi:2-polyprenyl-3-methyl-5-hydroxy-6-metoxy-1,4-benzoquinol methylase
MIPERLVPGTPEWDVYFVEHKQRYDFFANRCRGLRVLDAACGVGYGSQILAKAGAAEVVGVDISEEAIRYARTHFAHPCARFIKADLQCLDELDLSVDAVISFETIEHLFDPEKFVSGVHKALKPGGFFVCSTPNKDFGGKGSTANPYHVSELTFTEFLALCEKYLRVEERYHQSHSQSYLRHQALLREFESLQKRVRFSKLLSFENRARKLLGRRTWEDAPLSHKLWQAVPGDYAIEALEQPGSNCLSYIFAGRTLT